VGVDLNVSKIAQGWRAGTFAGSVAIALLSATPAFAPPPPPKPMPADISLDLALQGAQAAMAACAKIREHVAVAVVDRAEHIRVLLVADGYDRDWLQSVQRQAHTVLKTGMSSGDYGNSLNHDPRRILAAENADRDEQTAQGVRVPILMQPTPGAVPVMKAGVLVGVVSVSGNGPNSPYGYEYMGQVEPCAIVGRDKILSGLNSR